MASSALNVDAKTSSANAASAPKAETASNSNPSFPPPKTDKPRPHVCQTCGRSFARLEHLKRHERSHTKEKPFECPQCTRCFARRDLLLRHQQKLHQAGAASSRPRNGRRESTSGVQASPSTRVRKNSIASSGASGHAAPNPATMRPRANTISHIDGAALNLLMNQHATRPQVSHFGHHPSLSMSGPGDFDMRTMHMFGYNGVNPLPKIETNGLGLDLGGGLKTAPVSMMGEGYDVDKLFGSASTVNPAQLHFGGPIGTPGSPFNQGFPPLAAGTDDDDAFDWTASLADTLMSGTGEAIMDGSSPSAISTGSQSGFSEVMVDGSNNMATTSSGLWPNSIMVTSSQFTVDPVSAAVFPELVQQAPHTISPKDLHDHSSPENLLFSNAQPLATMSSTVGVSAPPAHYFQPPLHFGSDTTSISSTSANGSGRQSSITTMSTDSITDATRQALLFSLSQPSGFGHTGRAYSQPSISSPLSPPYGSRAPAQSISLPSTADLQRYVNAYIHYFHPHMPFLHIPTLSFDSPVFTSNMRAHHSFREGIVGGGGCLILAMAAIGASYEFEHAVAKELFESAKRIISIYLEERRKASASAVSNVSSGHGSAPTQKTPLWLVEAMLLNLIYGHQCGDKIAAEIATTHCAALIGLAKAADLENPDPDISVDENRSYILRNGNGDADVDMGDGGRSNRSWRKSTPLDDKDEHAEWFRWKSKEERKRTLLSVFVLSSLLVTAYNHQPRILNSEIHVDLPCEENLWAAESPKAWNALRAATAAQAKTVSFADALTFLLTASMRHQSDNRLSSTYQAFGSSVPLEQLPQSELKPSTFGCYILINALHVYIWETRQRHQGRQWKTQETEQMHGQVEPALRAWQAAWRSNPNHNLERPNPYGPLPADSIPLLDLAYVRLFVNLGRSKEAFWLRDFEAMADELGSGSEIIQHADTSRETSEPPEAASLSGQMQSPPSRAATQETILDMMSESPEKSLDSAPGSLGHSSKRERHLRKAAFYAADSLNMADKLGATFAEFTSRELPIQAAMCTFDCAQVLAEWIATVQQRVGRFLGILGRDDIDFTQVPAIMLLEDEDCKLLEKINEILHHADVKVSFDAAAMGQSPDTLLGPLKNSGYGSRLLLTTAYMLDKAAVWGITKIMARSMRIHAEFLKQRAEASLIS